MGGADCEVRLVRGIDGVLAALRAAEDLFEQTGTAEQLLAESSPAVGAALSAGAALRAAGRRAVPAPLRHGLRRRVLRVVPRGGPDRRVQHGPQPGDQTGGGT